MRNKKRQKDSDDAAAAFYIGLFIGAVASAITAFIALYLLHA